MLMTSDFGYSKCGATAVTVWALGREVPGGSGTGMKRCGLGELLGWQGVEMGSQGGYYGEEMFKERSS